MSKAVHWTIPFQSVKGINYEIRIYDDYTGSVPAAWPVTLQAGETPITTQEDASDDFFTPVRPSTGTISVIYPDGTLMEQLIPANNIARPVRLIKKGATAAQDTIEWQGFLSCEAYQQDYTAIAQELQLSIISVLEAMDSIKLNVSSASIKSVRLAIADCLEAVSALMPTNCYTNIFIPLHDADILDQRINTAILFEENEISQENKTLYEISSIGCKESIARICTYMGWVVREDGTNLFFDRIGEKSNYYVYGYSSFVGSATPSHTTMNKVSKNMSSFAYRGAEHQKSTSNGARSVAITAEVKKYELNFEIPECPYGNLTQTNYNQFHFEDETKYLYMLYNSAAVANLTLYYYRREVTLNIAGGQVNTITYDHEGNWTLPDMMTNGMPNAASNAPACKLFNTTSVETMYAGATLCKSALEDYITGRQWHETNDGLYCCFTPLYNTLVPGQTQYTPKKIWTIRKEMPVLLMCGWVRMDMKVKPIDNTMTVQSGEKEKDEEGKEIDTGTPMFVRMQLRIGDKYWNGSTWQSAACTWEMEFINGHPKYNDESYRKMYNLNDGYYMDLAKGDVHGDIEMSMYDISYLTEKMGDYTRLFVSEAIFEDIKLDFVVNPDATRSDRGSNHYYRLLDVNFKDDVEISTNIATDLNNIPSASLVIDKDNDNEFVKRLAYTTGSGTVYEMPERDLLNRMADYYGRIRRTIQLIIEHPSSTYFPICTVTGYDNRKYLPLAEERDWQQDTSKLTCYETPDGDA